MNALCAEECRALSALLVPNTVYTLDLVFELSLEQLRNRLKARVIHAALQFAQYRLRIEPREKNDKRSKQEVTRVQISQEDIDLAWARIQEDAL